MTELDKIKKEASEIVRGMSNDFIMLSNNHIEDDIWEIMARSEHTGLYYTFKSEGSEFYDFKEKP